MESLRTDARLWVIGFRLIMHYGAKGESILTAHQHSPPRRHRRLTQLGGHPPLRTHRSATPYPQLCQAARFGPVVRQLPSRDEAEQAYEQLVKRAATEAGQPIKPERYHAIVYSHNGQARRATVGERDPLKGDETIVALLECESGLFLIYTEKAGQDGIIGPNLAYPISTVHFDQDTA